MGGREDRTRACAAASARLIAVGGGKGVVRLFAATTLAYEGRPRPAAVDAAESADAAKDPSSVRFPAATACAFGATGNVLAVAYADGSVVVWDVARGGGGDADTFVRRATAAPRVGRASARRRRRGCDHPRVARGSSRG